MTKPKPDEYWVCVHPPAPDPNAGAEIVMLVHDVFECEVVGTLANGLPDVWEYLEDGCTFRPATEAEIATYKMRAIEFEQRAEAHRSPS